MKMELEWQDPPVVGRSSKWAKIFGELKENPNRWAKLYEGESHNAYSMAGRLRPRWAEFEIISRKTGEETAGVYAQYVPAVIEMYDGGSVDAEAAIESSANDFAEEIDRVLDGGGSELG
jgi:hypothetical protein